MGFYKKTLIASSILCLSSSMANAESISEMFARFARTPNDVVYESSTKNQDNQKSDVKNYQQYERPASATVILNSAQTQGVESNQVLTINSYEQSKPLESYGKKEIPAEHNVKKEVTTDNNIAVVPYVNPYKSSKAQYPAPKLLEPVDDAKQVQSNTHAKQNVQKNDGELPGVKVISKNKIPQPPTTPEGSWEPLKSFKAVPVVSIPEPKKIPNIEELKDKTDIANALRTTPSVKSSTIISKPGTNTSTPAQLTGVEIEFIKLAKKESEVWSKIDQVQPDSDDYLKYAIVLNELWAAVDELKSKSGIDPEKIEAVAAIKAASNKKSADIVAHQKTESSKVTKKEITDVKPEIKKDDELSKVSIKKEETVVSSPKKENVPLIITNNTEKVIDKPKPLVITPNTKIEPEPIKQENKNKKGAVLKDENIQKSSLPIPTEVKVTPIPSPDIVKTSLDK